MKLLDNSFFGQTCSIYLVIDIELKFNICIHFSDSVLIPTKL